MTRINLLPWREWEQRKRRTHFLLSLLLAFIIAVAIIYWAYLMVGSAVSAQQERNSYLRRQLVMLNQKINKIEDLKETKQALIHRMHIIQGLQQSRPLEVHLFEELATTVPSSVYLTHVVFTDHDKEKGSRVAGTLKLKGVADSPAGVSNYMRSMASSLWLDVPQLEVVRTQDKSGARRSSFSVNTKLLAPKSKQGKKQEAGS